MDSYQKIRDALAMGPTRGIRYARDQEVSGPYGVGVAWCGTNMTSGRDGSYSIDTTEACANASLAAACDPSTIQALLDERDELLEALRITWKVIDAAGLGNLVNGVQLGPVSWLIKAEDAKAESLAAIAKATGGSQ